jgi:hypothetical protein
MTSCSKELVATEVRIFWELADIFPFLDNSGYATAGQPRASAVSLAVNNVPTKESYSRHADGSKTFIHGFEAAR